MSNRFVEWIKHHPLESGGIVFAAGILYLILHRTSSAGTTGTSTSASDVATIQADAAVQAAQIQAQSQANQFNAAAGVQNNQTAAQVSIATIAGQVQTNNDTLAAQTSQVIAGLQAQVANYSTAASVQINGQNDSTLEAVALAPYQLQEAEIAAQAGSLSAQQLATINGEIANVANLAGGAAANVAAYAQTGVPDAGVYAANDISQLNNIANTLGTTAAISVNPTLTGGFIQSHTTGTPMPTDH